MANLHIKLCRKNAKIPGRATEHSAGYDIYACLDDPVELPANGRLLVPSGFQLALPHDVEAQIRPRSGLAIKHGITLLNSPGTIDADYRGEIKLILQNHSNESFTIEPGMRIGQMVFQRVLHPAFLEVDELDDTDRGSGGFGHTGL